MQMHKISMGMLGGFGVALGSGIIKEMTEDKHLKPSEEIVEPIDPWGKGKREKRLTSSFETKDSELYCFGLDTRFQDFTELQREFGEDLYGKVYREPAKGFERTEGMGGDYEACLDYIRSTENVEERLKSYLKPYLEECNLLLPIFSLDGGSGNGFFRYIVNLGLKGVNILPIITSPLNNVAWNQVRGREGTFYRKDTTLETIEWLGNLLKEKAITSAILTDNDFSTYSGMIKRDFIDFVSVKSAFDEIGDKNFDKFKEIYGRGRKMDIE